MSSALESSQSNQGLRALDPDLILLASEAAIDIDNLLSHRSTDLTVIRRLAAQLKNSIEVDTSGSAQRSLMDPATLNILSGAVMEATEKKSLNKVEELLREAAKIATTLSRDNPMEAPDELRQARDFCGILKGCDGLQ